MKPLLIILFAAISHFAIAQNNLGKSDDAARIALTAYVPEQIDQMPEAARSSLANKLSQIATQNGLSGSTQNQRFIITANVNILSKEVTASAPPMQAFVLDITLYIGDGVEGTKFASVSTQAKGIGESETKAYISALKNIKTNDPKYQDFIETGKARIIEYYNSRCDFIIKEAQSLASQSKYEEAIYKLTSVPEVSKGCYDKCMDAIAPIYQQQIDRQCKIYLNDATNAWNSNQNGIGADQASSMLSNIDPNASCYAEAKALSDKIAKRIKEIDQREWNFKLKQQQDETDITKARIKAARDIGVAYGNGQPKSITYNIRGWW